MGITSRKTLCSLTSKKFLPINAEIFLVYLRSRSLGGNFSRGTSLQEGGHLILLHVLRNVLRGLPVLVLGLQVDLGLDQDLGDLPKPSGGSAMERSLAVPVGQVDVSSLLDESLDNVNLESVSSIWSRGALQLTMLRLVASIRGLLPLTSSARLMSHFFSNNNYKINVNKKQKYR